MALSPDVLSAAASLYRDEEASWDDDDEVTCVVSPQATPPVDAAPYLQDGNGRTVTALLAAELELSPCSDYPPCSVDSAARQGAVSWILKLHEFHCFRPVTACLAVNYLDRFLSSHTLPDPGEGENNGGNGWPIQLLSVACLSVAAKMEETQIPLLLDLQVLEPRFVFEPCTVRRMELLLMTALQWRMRAVTPFDFFEPIAGSAAARCRGLLPRATELVLSTLRVADFLRYPPSAIAAASLLCAADELAYPSSSLVVDLTDFPESFGSVTANQCRRLMEDYVIDMCPFARRGCRCAEPPPSPAGVLDAAAACSSCETRTSVSSIDAAAPPPKRRRRSGGDVRCTASFIITGGDGNC